MKIFVKHERADSVVSPDKSDAAVRAEVSESEVNSEIELLTNSELLRQVVLRNGLEKQQSGRPGEAVERAVRRLAKDLSVTPVRKANIIQVTYQSTGAAQSAAVLSTLGEVYLQEHLRVHRTAGTYEFFRNQAQQYEQQLQEAQARLSDFRRRNGVVVLSEQKDLMLRRVMDTEQAMNETSASLDEAAGRVGTVKGQLSTLQPRVVTQSRVVPNQYSVERLHTMLAELQNRRTDLLAKFRADDRLVKEVEDQIKDTSAALDRASKLTAVEQTTDVNPLRQSLEGELARAEMQRAGVQARRDTLAGALRAWKVRLTKLDQGTAEYEDINRELKRAEENVILYSKKQEEARIADSLDQQKIANVSIAEAPSQPYLPFKPNVALNLVAGLCLAVFVSVGTAFALELRRSTFGSADELHAATNVPVLAVVPARGA